MPVRESTIEDYLVKQVKAEGGRAYKFTSSAYRSIPDRMCVFPRGVLVFVELKAPGRQPTKRQWQEIEFLQRMGQLVVVIDSRPKVKKLIEWYRRHINVGNETT
jgi:hypothetical protein